MVTAGKQFSAYMLENLLDRLQNWKEKGVLEKTSSQLFSEKYPKYLNSNQNVAYSIDARFEGVPESFHISKERLKLIFGLVSDLIFTTL